jgi:hypothetical protein
MSLRKHSFEHHLKSISDFNLHPYIDIHLFPSDLSLFRNCILFGQNGIGKYSQALHIISKYSPSLLNYEHTITPDVSYSKTNNIPYNVKMSDVHFEIDMSILGNNPKAVWHELFQFIVDIVSSRTNKDCILLCKYFHSIKYELLECFYSYMQQQSNCNFHFILLTNNISFIPFEITNCCEIIPLCRPSKSAYETALNITNASFFKEITNMNIAVYVNANEIYNENIMHKHKQICNSIIHRMKAKEINIRDELYDIITYGLDLYECIWYIVQTLIDEGHITNVNRVLAILELFFDNYQNNYRPIYHLEWLFLSLEKEMM